MLKYAAVRNVFYNKGTKLECFVSYEPCMAMFNEWLKQLFAESEGKDGKGLFPVSCIFSTDLHSLGQYIQESGSKLMFETVIKFNNPHTEFLITEQEGNIDGLNFLAGKKMSYVNEKAREGTLLAHTDGGGGNLVIECDTITPSDQKSQRLFCPLPLYIYNMQNRRTAAVSATKNQRPPSNIEKATPVF